MNKRIGSRLRRSLFLNREGRGPEQIRLLFISTSCFVTARKNGGAVAKEMGCRREAETGASFPAERSRQAYSSHSIAFDGYRLQTNDARHVYPRGNCLFFKR